jgi:hypothetical protein
MHADSLVALRRRRPRPALLMILANGLDGYYHWGQALTLRSVVAKQINLRATVQNSGCVWTNGLDISPSNCISAYRMRCCRAGRVMHTCAKTPVVFYLIGRVISPGASFSMHRSGFAPMCESSSVGLNQPTQHTTVSLHNLVGENHSDIKSLTTPDLTAVPPSDSRPTSHLFAQFVLSDFDRLIALPFVTWRTRN